MSDIATVWNPQTGTAGWMLSLSSIDLVEDGTGASVVDRAGAPLTTQLPPFVAGQGLLAGNDLVTAVIISICTDATAGPDDIIPDGSTDPRGWWGDETIGSKLWLRLRSKKSDTLLALVKNDIETALAWLITDGVATSVDVTTAWQGNMLAARIVIHRGDGTSLRLNFAWAWGAT